MSGRDGFAAVDERVVSWVRDGGVGGLAWAIAIGDDVTTGAAGWLDPDERQRPMRADALFRISSVTKPIVAVAALQLVDDGLIGLDEPVDGVLGELAGRRVLTDPTGPLDQSTVPADRALTLRDLLTFRCGLGMQFTGAEPQPVLARLSDLGIGPGPTAPACTPDAFMARLADLPLADQPGTRWRYHTGSDIVGVLIERMRGEPLDAVLARDVLAPLGMVDTAFWVGADRQDRLGACRMATDGEPATWDPPDGRWSASPLFRSGATGLVSTAADLIAFGRMLLRGGEGPDGVVLSPSLAKAMTTDQLSDDQRSSARIDDRGAALGWGLGLAVRHDADPGPWPPIGSYGWDGGLGSRWLVDPTHDVCAVVLSTDAFASADAPPVFDDVVAGIAEVIGV